MPFLVLIGTLGHTGAAQTLCNPAAIEGSYGFQLTGDTKISGDPKPTVSVGRLVLDAPDHLEGPGSSSTGSLTGVSSANFAGYFLGNPVTGTYAVHQDCSISWSQQDDSGAFQHFSGTLSPDGQTARFRQTDRGGAGHGILAKTPDACGPQTLQSRYRLLISGSTTPMQAGEQAGAVSVQGVAENRGDGALVLTSDSVTTAGKFQVGEDCFVQLELELPQPEGNRATMKFRGILVSGGQQILGMQTDPGTAVAITLTAR